jgi:hypothetical protein
MTTVANPFFQRFGIVLKPGQLLPDCLLLGADGQANWSFKAPGYRLVAGPLAWPAGTGWDTEFSIMTVVGTVTETGSPAGAEPPPADGDLLPLSIGLARLEACIRKRRLAQAIYLANLYLRVDPRSVLDLIGQQCLDASLPIHGYTTFTWYRLAITYNWPLNEEGIAWLLGYLYQLIRCPYHDRYTEVRDKVFPRLGLIKNLSIDGKNLCLSLATGYLLPVPVSLTSSRRRPNVRYLEALLLWLSRYRTKSSFLELLTPVDETRYIVYTGQPVINYPPPLESINSRSCPGLVSHLWTKHDNYPESEIAEALTYAWRPVSQALGLRPEPKPYARQVWDQIRDSYYGFAQYIIDRTGGPEVRTES